MFLMLLGKKIFKNINIKNVIHLLVINFDQGISNKDSAFRNQTRRKSRNNPLWPQKVVRFVGPEPA